MKLVSVVVPCYNEQEVLPMFYEEITKVTDNMKKENPELEFEYLFINDGSKDRTLEIFRELATKDKRVRYISFSRNFGKESGMYAGLKNSRGDYVVVMDADLQHPPAFLPQMYNYVKNGEFDCATTRRISRTGESKVRSWFARMFYKIMNKISDTEIVDGAQDFRFMTRQMVDAILEMSEYNRFSKGIFSWVGFRVKYMPYENVERPAGTTSWSFWGLFKYSLEGIMAFSTFPLALSIFFGIFCLILAMIIFMAGLILSIVTDIKFGWFAVIAAVFAVGGIQLGCAGILGQYISKMYLEVKKRPIYIAGETDGDYRKKVNPNNE
ncbi:MAG: glycosyltransferase family 2 protein [Ruminococcus sp.]|nr:glycosyltransferase family 2 protein [Ruminococcus sp.]